MKSKYKPFKTAIHCSVYLLLAALTIANISCSLEDHTSPVTKVTPKGPKPSWAPMIKDEMWAVVEKLLSYGDKPIPLSTPQEARMNHTVKDAVMDLVAEFKVPVPPSMVDTMGRKIDVEGGQIHARIYTPKTGSGPFPVIVYYHGGGWVIANIDVYDASAKALAEQVGAVVVSVGYRKGPEHKFPTAHNDAFAAYKWVLANAASINGNPDKIGVAGESAGGNLAANVSIMARDMGIKKPVHQLLVYPVANSDLETESYKKFGDAKPLDKASIIWFLGHFLNNMNEAKDPRITLVAANLKDLPSTTIITAEIDPLQSDGLLLQQKLTDAGVDSKLKNYDGVTHEFFGTAIIVPEAKEAQAYASAEFKAAFNK